MKCPKCHAENMADSRFCSRCATPLNPAEAGQPSFATRTLVDPFSVVSKDGLIGGKYRIIEEIGRGGMGVVYRAEDIRLKRDVALKFLPSQLADFAELRERFLIEAQAAAALSHPNICVIHEVGETEDRPYMAMEYVEGETLRDKIKKRPIEPKEAVVIVSQIAAGLAAAHSKGIIHRDIKSANIMVTGKRQAKIMDFGLAKLRGGSSLTRSQTTLGTVAYMSPEQARGEEVDGRTDLWSLGVVLYEMLTGELPFRGDQDLSVIHSIINEEPKPLKQRKPPIPEELRQVVSRALRKNRDSRYGSAGDMLKDLKAYETSLRLEQSGVLSFKALVRRLRRPAVAIPTLLAVIAVAALTVWFFKHRAQVRWAREEVLPEIERMIGETDAWRNLVPPYRLAEKAEAVLGNDPKLAALLSKCSLNIDIRTEPPGAGVYVKEYETPEAEWSYLGVTPLEKIRMPVDIFRWKLEKEGYETVLAASSTWNRGSSKDKPGAPLPYDLVRVLDKTGSLPPGLVRVQGGQTQQGELDDFFIDRYEVTNKQYKEFIDAGGYRKKEYWKHKFLKEGRELTWEEAIGEFVDQTDLSGPSTWSGGDYLEGEGDYPVSGVSWYEAAAYAEYAGKSLPTIAHWDIARGALTPMGQVYQRAGFALYAPFSNIGGGKGPVEVGSLSGITPFGAFDMAGNVREWCWNETPMGRAVRGGAWDDNIYEFGNIRQAPPMDRSAKNGFRCALYPNMERIPATALQFENLVEPRDLYRAARVPDPVFQVFKEQFSYDKTDLDAREESREDKADGWTHEKITFNAAYGGERVLAHLFLPRNARPPYQTVIYFPGSASTWRASSRDIEDYYEFTMFLSFLVKTGRAVVYPVYKGTFERVTPSSPAIHVGAPTHEYTEFLVQVVKDFRRCIDYLETRPDIDAGKLAFYGMSWGGALGSVIPAVEERLKVSILVPGGIYHRIDYRPEADPINYVTRVRTPTLMLNGRYDSSFGLETGIRPMFDLLGTPDEHKRLMLYETDHIPPRTEYIKEILAWLDKYFGPAAR